MATAPAFRDTLPRRVRRRLAQPDARWLAFVLVLVVLTNPWAFTTRYSVAWDATDAWFFYMRWFGACLREGEFGDYFPQIGSGYPIGGDIVAGAYSPLYLLFGFLFPRSALAVNLLYVTLQLLVAVTAFRIALSFRMSAPAAAVVALTTLGSGYFIGHASHFSYFLSSWALMLCWLGLRLAGAGRHAMGAAMIATAAFNLGVAGSPEHAIFGSLVLLPIAGGELWRAADRRRFAAAAAGGLLAGVALASPALSHFAGQLVLSRRGHDLPLAAAIAGSLPLPALANFLNPFWPVRAVPDVDPTMAPFHLLALTPALLVAGLLCPRRMRPLFWAGLALAVLFTILALGPHSPIPLRVWLAEQFFLFRVGRFPSGQHRGFALFCLALAAGAALDALAQPGRRPIVARVVAVLVALDFTAVTAAGFDWRYQRSGAIAPFRVRFEPRHAKLVDAPRLCDVTVNGPQGQERVPPDRFSWSGYTNLVSARYLAERESMRWALCGPSRLWDARTREARNYQLGLYSPGVVEFAVRSRGPGDVVLWADVDDGRWGLTVNDRPAAFVDMPADLRGIDLGDLPAGAPARIRMAYHGPLSRFWR